MMPSATGNRMLSFIRYPNKGPVPADLQGSAGPEAVAQTQQPQTKQQPQQLFQNQQLQEHFQQQIQQQQRQPQSQTQAATQRQNLRQHHLTEAHKLPVPKTGPQHASSQPSASGIPRGQTLGLAQAEASQRLRANSDGIRAAVNAPSAAARQNHDTWEDSTIGSLLDSERQSDRGQQRNAVSDPPFGSVILPQSQSVPATLDRSAKAATTRTSELGPFVLNDRGYIKSLERTRGAAAVHHSLNNGETAETVAAPDEPYADRSEAGSTPKKQLKHTKYAIRDTRDVARGLHDTTRRRSYLEAPVYAQNQDNFVSYSPERHQNGRELAGRSHADRHSRNFDHHRSTQFFDLETPHLTPAPRDDQSDLASAEDEGPGQRTPRPNQQPLGLSRGAVTGFPPILSSDGPRPNGTNSLPPIRLPASRQDSYPPSPSAKGPSKRSSNNRDQSAAAASAAAVAVAAPRHNKKRRLSLDYDDQVLAKMSYTDLQNEEFDHDPARAAVQRANTPSSGDSLAQKLAHYQSQDESSQHGFFTRLTVGEWDECGDWFLDQFGELVSKFKAARREKREMVNSFESQISAREEAVRTRTEKIERTLSSLKQEGEGMMRGKAMNL